MAVLSFTNKNKYFRIIDRVNPISALIVYLLLYLSIILWAAWKYNLWFPTTTRNGLLTEPSALINDLLFQPCIVAYYFWSDHAIMDLFDSIKEAFISENHYKRVVSQLDHRLNNKRQAYYFWAFSICFTIFAYASYSTGIRWGFQNAPLATWWSEHPIIYLIASPLIIFSCYASLTLGYRFIAHNRSLADLFDTDQLKVLPKDKDGGLGPIGKFSANLSWMIAVTAGMFLFSALQTPHNFYKDVILMSGIGIYILVAPILFFAPMMSAHSAMVNYKNKQRQIVSNEWYREFEKLQQLQSKDASETRSIREKMKQLEEDISMIDKFPTFPFDINAIKKYFSIILAPLLPILISLITDLIKRLFS